MNPDHRPPVHGHERRCRRCKGPRAEGSTSTRSSHDDTKQRGGSCFIMTDRVCISDAVSGERNVRLLCQGEVVKENLEKQSDHAHYTTVVWPWAGWLMAHDLAYDPLRREIRRPKLGMMVADLPDEPLNILVVFSQPFLPVLMYNHTKSFPARLQKTPL